MSEAEERVAEIVEARKDTPPDSPSDAKARQKAHLRPPWKPGESGNPAGKPKGALSLTAMLRAKLQEIPPGEERKTYADLLIESTVVAAVKSDAQARKLAWEYIEGQARQHVAVSTGEDAELADAVKALTDEQIAQVMAIIAGGRTA